MSVDDGSVDENYNGFDETCLAILGQGHIGLYKYEYRFWYLQNFFSLQKMVLMSVDDGSVDENCTMDLNI